MFDMYHVFSISKLEYTGKTLVIWQVSDNAMFKKCCNLFVRGQPRIFFYFSLCHECLRFFFQLSLKALGCWPQLRLWVCDWSTFMFLPVLRKLFHSGSYQLPNLESKKYFSSRSDWQGLAGFFLPLHGQAWSYF